MSWPSVHLPSLRLLLLAAAGVALGLIVATCGGTPATPTSPPTPPPATPTPTPSPTPTPGRPPAGHGLRQPHAAAPAPPAAQGPRRRARPVRPRLEAAGRERERLLRQGGLRRLEVLRDAAGGPPRARGLRLPRHRQGAGHRPLGTDLVLRRRPVRVAPGSVREPRGQPVPGDREGQGRVPGLRGRRAGRSRRAARAAARSRSSSGLDDAQRPRSRARIDFGRGHWHRFSGGTPRRACSTWAPHPAHVGLPHCVQRTWWHISPPPPPRTTTCGCGRRSRASSRARRSRARSPDAASSVATVKSRLDDPGWTRSPVLRPWRPLPATAGTTVKPLVALGEQDALELRHGLGVRDEHDGLHVTLTADRRAPTPARTRAGPASGRSPSPGRRW